MSNHAYKKIEIVGTSETSQDDAIQNAIAKAAKSVRDMRWFEVVESRGAIRDGKVNEFQVPLGIGFRLDD